MRGDEIEFFAEIGQKRLRIDSSHDAANAEELGRTAEERFVILIEPETFVAEQMTNIEKVTGATA